MENLTFGRWTVLGLLEGHYFTNTQITQQLGGPAALETYHTSGLAALITDLENSGNGKAADRIRQYRQKSPTRGQTLLKICQEQGIQLLFSDEEAYPCLLREIPDHPSVLFYMGNPGVLDSTCIAIVGSRKICDYGARCASDVAYACADAGFTVVSGLARGIDAVAHQAALEGGGTTAAVLPCSVDICYPKINLWLYHRIMEQGLLLSAYPPHSQIEKWFFTERNRIVSGLSTAVVVAQAGPKSGSILTAESAAEQGRDVFCVPGSIYSPDYYGCHNLIQDGANILTNPARLTDYYQHGDKQHQMSLAQMDVRVPHLNGKIVRREKDPRAVETALRLAKQNEKKMDEAGPYAYLYSLVDDLGCTAEELIRKSGKDAESVQQALTALELKGLLKETGGVVARC